MADRITVAGIRGFGHHGVLAHETELGQEFTVDVALEVDLQAAAASDDLTDTVDYGQVAATVHECIVGEPRKLIEALAGDVADAILALNTAIKAVEVAVHKPHAPMPVGVADVVVSLRRVRPARVVLGLGANQGDAVAALERAISGLSAIPGVQVQATSDIFRTSPVGGVEQPDFHNAVAVVGSELSAPALLRECQRLEGEAGRVRDQRWGPRTLDIDILDFDGARVLDPDLVLPHPRIAERGFVLEPWAQVAPADRPGRQGRTVAELAAAWRESEQSEAAVEALPELRFRR